METYNCLACLDSKYLAVSINDPSYMVPMFEIAGLGAEDYRLMPCTCQQGYKKKWSEIADGAKRSK